MGRRRATRRAIRANFRGLPKLSVYRAMTDVASSSSQNCSRSLPEMSHLSPNDTNHEMPIDICPARCSSDEPSEPDCMEMAMRPRGRSTGTSAALRPVPPGSALEAMPMLAGPMRRRPLRRACSTRPARSKPALSSVWLTPVSTAVTTTAPRTRLAMHWSIVAGSAATGTAMTASHTSSAMAATDGWHGTPSRCVWRGLTANTGTPERCTLRHSSRPIEPCRSEAPMTAIERGSNRRATARLSARCSRLSTESTNCSVSSTENSTSTMPLSKCRLTGHPARLNTASIDRLSARVSAVNRAMPLVRAIAARCSSSSVAMPLPRWSASTMNATSASERPFQRS